MPVIIPAIIKRVLKPAARFFIKSYYKGSRNNSCAGHRKHETNNNQSSQCTDE